MSPSLRQSAGSALDRVRCVGHSPIHRHGDTIRNVAKTVSKEKMKMVNLFIGLPSAFLFAMSYGGPFAPKKKKKNGLYLLSEIVSRNNKILSQNNEKLSQNRR